MNKVIRKSAAQRVSAIALDMERMGLAEYISMMQNKKRLLWTNFISGVARGLGIAVGFSILGAILITIIQRAAVSNLPLIGDFLADVVLMVQRKL
jgi:zinc transporter ZupT